jgi:hypothetical protein
LTFCTDNSAIGDFFDGLGDTVEVARKAFLAVCIVLAVLIIIPMGYWEVVRWRHMQRRAALVHANQFDPLDVIQIASRPTTSSIGIKAAARFKSTRKQILVRWFVAYATSMPALFVLALGLAGLVACLFQYILLKEVEKQTPKLANEVGEFAGLVVNKLNSASQSWATGANGVITNENNDINQNMLGWVQNGSLALNNTLNAFVGNMTSVLNDTFGGTPLETPVQGVFDCLIGLKVAGIEKALTWAHDNAQVSFPLLPNDTFSLGAIASISSDANNASDSFLANPQSKATDEITNAVAKLTAKLASIIAQEAEIAACIVGVWFFIVLIGAVRVLIGFCGRDKTRAEGGPSYPGAMSGGQSPYTGDNRDGFATRSPKAGTAGFPLFAQASDADIAPPAASHSTGGGVPLSEKVGYAGERRDVNIGGAVHERKSSYGWVGEEKR